MGGSLGLLLAWVTGLMQGFIHILPTCRTAFALDARALWFTLVVFCSRCGLWAGSCWHASNRNGPVLEDANAGDTGKRR
jgi:hypothetical protein